MRQLLQTASVHGARALGLNGSVAPSASKSARGAPAAAAVGTIAAGFRADFALLDMRAAAFANSPPLRGQEFLAAAFFGCGGAGVVRGTAVNGRLRLSSRCQRGAGGGGESGEGSESGEGGGGGGRGGRGRGRAIELGASLVLGAAVGVMCVAALNKGKK